MLRILGLLWVGCVAVYSINVQAVVEAYEFETEQARAQFYQVIPLLRCPKCQNQSIADSDAPIAKDIKQRVQRLIKEGYTNEQIIEYMIARYGDFVSYRPPLRVGTWALWYGPPLLMIGLLIWLWWGRRMPIEAANDAGLESWVADDSEPLTEQDGKSKPTIPAAWWWGVIVGSVLSVGVLYGVSERFTQVKDWSQRKAALVDAVDQAIVEPDQLLPLLQDKEGQALIDVILVYQQALQQKGGSAQAWFALAQVYERINQLDFAYQAMRKAYLLAPDQVTYAIHLVQVDLQRQPGVLSAYSKRLLDRLLGQYPKDPRVLSFVGLAYQSIGQVEQAKPVLETLLAVVEELGNAPPEVTVAVKKLLTKIEADSAASDENRADGIQVEVALPADIQAQLSGDEFVFVYAKAVSGPKFPLAVIRQTMADWPVAVVLSDANAMMEGVGLSQFEQVLVGARISSTGQAVAQPGDWQSPEIEVNQQKLTGPVQLVIQDRVR